MSGHHLLVVVPYRGRGAHMEEFLDVMPAYLHKEGIKATIVIAEQADFKPFNRGKLLNMGVIEANGAGIPYTHIAFHDVDMLPIRPGAGYGYKGPALQVHSPTPYSMGGISIVSKEVNDQANGWANSYWGWGGEDRNYMDRVKSVDYEDVYCYEPCIRGSVFAKQYFRELDTLHDPDRKSTKKQNSRVTKGFRRDSSKNAEDGLNSCEYRYVKVRRNVGPPRLEHIEVIWVEADLSPGYKPNDS